MRSLTRGFKYSDLTWKLLVFWKLVAEEKWLFTRGGRKVRLYFSYPITVQLNSKLLAHLHKNETPLERSNVTYFLLKDHFPIIILTVSLSQILRIFESEDSTTSSLSWKAILLIGRPYW